MQRGDLYWVRSLERLFELDRQRKLEPVETMEVPVVKLELVA